MKIEKIEIELTTACNARCKLCLRTNREVDINEINFEVLKDFIEPILKDLKVVILCGSFGDSIFYSHLFELLELIDSVPKIMIATNGSVGDKNFWARLAKYKSVQVIFALDGLEKSHELHRKGTKFNDVVRNIDIYIKNGGNAIVQMILFKHNENEVEDVKKLVEGMGASIFYRISRKYDDEFQKPSRYEMKELNKIRDEEKTFYCQFVEENHIFISAKGEVVPCCHYNPDKFTKLLGNHEELNKVYELSKNDTNVYTSNIEKVFKSRLFVYIMKHKAEIPYCKRECAIRISDKMFKEIHIK